MQSVLDVKAAWRMESVKPLCLSSGGRHSTTEQRSRQQECISHRSGGWNSKVNVQTHSVPGEGPVPSWQRPPSHCVLEWPFLSMKRERERSVPLLIRPLTAPQGPHPHDLNPNLLPEAPSPRAITLGVRASADEFRGYTDIQPRKPCSVLFLSGIGRARPREDPSRIQ